MGTRRVQEPSLSLVVAGGGLEMCFYPVCTRLGILCLENLFMSRFFTLVTAIIVVPYYMVRIRSCLFMCVTLYSVIPYGYINVDSSYSSLSGGLLHSFQEDRCAVGREAWGLVGGRGRAFHSWWQEGLGVCFSPVCARFGIFCLENAFMSRFFTSITALVFPYYMDRIRSFLFICVILYK